MVIIKCKAIWLFVMDFCANSSIHGVRYFTERKRHWTERFWWIIAFVLSVWLCGTSIQHIWIKWSECPVKMNLAEEKMPISEIPYPTITLCPQTKASKDKLDVISAYHAIKNQHMNLTDIKLTRMEAFIQTCKIHKQEAIHFGQDFVNDTIFDIIQDIAPSLNSTFDDCEWQDQILHCSKFLTPILTAEGLCFTFNALNSKDIYTDEMAPEMKMVKDNQNVTNWNPETGYETRVSHNDYPIRVFNAWQDAVLFVQMRLSDRDLEYLCQGPLQGFKLFLSSPGDTLKMSQDYFIVSHSEGAKISIKPSLITTSKDLLGYKPNQRQCFFNSERQLKFFRFYSQHNCEAECLANFTMMECECVKFSMPREKDAQICGAANIECYQAAGKKIFGEDICDGLTDEVAKQFRRDCNCLPSCTSIEYDADIDRAKFDFKATLTSYKISLDQYSGMKLSTVSISFKNHLVMAFKRSASYTYTDFFAICGGLLGLFLGVSALSIIEFIYYSTLRLFCTIRQCKSENIVKPFK